MKPDSAPGQVSKRARFLNVELDDSAATDSRCGFLAVLALPNQLYVDQTDVISNSRDD